MEGWKNFLNKNVKIVFDDGRNVSIKQGTLKECNDSYLLVLTNQGEEAISVSRVIRLEVWGGS